MSKVFSALTVSVDHPHCQELPGHLRLRLADVVAAPGVTHLHY